MPTFKLGERETRSPGRKFCEATEGEIEYVIQHLEALSQGEPGVDGCVVELNNYTVQDALSIAEGCRNRLINRPTQSFNVRHRAVAVPKLGGVVFTDNLYLQQLASWHGLLAWRGKVEEPFLAAQRAAQRGEETSGFESHLPGIRKILDESLSRPWIPLRKDVNIAYYGPAPRRRGPRQRVAGPSGNLLHFPWPQCEIIESLITLTGPCTKGSRTPSQAVVMRHSALNYAKAVGVPEADTTTWEWLHLIGNALGGQNVLGNLVAGTYDSNTQMTMMENRIAKYCETQATINNPATLRARAKMYKRPDGLVTWVAERIVLQLTHRQTVIMQGEFGATISAEVNRMEYDYYDYLFGIQSRTAQSYWEHLFSQG